MPNRLAHESSPYLLQHQHNPVDWYPWGPEALERARREDRAIFLSIGYSACHWCHVMEHESFENPAIAQLMNERFVNIKVDREERPDLDQIYMNSVQLMTGHGGWPMSVFLTPDLRPFFGGTYFPPRGRQGLPGFDQVVLGVHDAWTNRRSDALAAAERLTEALQELAIGAGLGDDDAGTAGDQSGLLQPALLTDAARALERSFDFTNGGFGSAPKFPHAMDLRVLLRVWKRQNVPGALDMVRLTLDKMAAGGIYDHLGGGFHRYSVDARWLVPHFEKMLYDNALLAGCYVEAWQATGEAAYQRVARETLDYVLREMTDPTGGFYSTQDADSEGEEGKFYVWSPAEVTAVLGDAGATFCRVFDVTERGNFEGHNILNLPKPLAQQAQLLGRDVADLERELADGKAKLYTRRLDRVPPGLDDKVLVSWNALAIEALAMAGAAFGEPRYTLAAEKAAGFLLHDLRRADGRLLHGWRAGQAKLDAYLDDYAYLANALVALYEATQAEQWIVEAVRLAEVMLEQFADAEGGGFFFTAADHEQLIARNKDAHDASVPSASGMAATAFGRLGKLTGRSDFLQAAEGTLALYAPLMHRSPAAAGQLLLALDAWLGPSPELALVGVAGDAVVAEALAAIHRRFMPGRLVAAWTAAPATASPLAGLFAGKSADAGPALYVCQNFACQAPAVGRDAVLAQIARL